ncbi:MAG: beta-galactosidase, partial [Bacteroidales bacterium]|nr:beta-galactosidase [Bacteroidales bacterium]
MKRILLMAALLAAVSCSTNPSWKPVEGHIMTCWAQDVNPSSPLPEYPRPAMVREGKWKNLNGLWDYAIVPAGEPAPDQFQGKILVPFAPESALSGVGMKVTPEDALWYETSFSWKKGESTLLHFGAVDNEAQVWVNGELAGSHSGGYTGFTLDITPYLKPSGKQTVRVRVLDGSDNNRHPRGKQVLDPKGIWYT